MVERIGAFELGEQLGAGAMGQVYRARDPRLERDVAVKVLGEGIRDDAERIRRFETEARAAAALSHPNVMAIYDVGIDEGRPFLICELIEGETLRTRLGSGALTWRKAVELATQIAAGLAAAHAHRITHRDIKPANIMIGRDGRVKILDFGVARIEGTAAPQGESTLDGAVIGTAGYMAPEQVRGEPADARSDIFALGAVLYEMLAGKKAFDGETDTDRGYAVLRHDPADLPASVPGPLSRIVRRCLEKRPDERFESARDLGFALDAISNASSTATSTRPPEARRRWPIAVAAAGVLLALGLAVGWIAHRPEESTTAQRSYSFTPLTFRRGIVISARFAPQRDTTVYTASWDGEASATYLALSGHEDARAIYAPGAEVLAISARGDVALKIAPGDMLAVASIAGGEPRVLSPDVVVADWIPGGDELAVVRREGARYVLEFPAGNRVHESTEMIGTLRVSRDGKYAAIAAQSNALWELIIVGRDGSKTIRLRQWMDVVGLAWSPDQRELLFSGTPPGRSLAMGGVYAVDARGITRTLLEGPALYTLHDAAGDGRLLISVDAEHRRAASHRVGDPVDRDLSWYGRTSPAGLSASGEMIAFNERGHAPVQNPWAVASFIRRLDGSPPVKLGDAFVATLSPDGKHAVVFQPTDLGVTQEQLVLVPTGPGASRAVPHGAIRIYRGVTFFPDGKSLAFSALEANAKERIYVQDIAHGEPRAITPPDTFFIDGTSPISPDGAWIVAHDGTGTSRLFPIGGGSPRDIPKLERGELPLSWASDGRLYVSRKRSAEIEIYAVDVTTGVRTALHTIKPIDPAGIGYARIAGTVNPSVLISPDGQTYVYSHVQTLSQLFIAERMR